MPIAVRNSGVLLGHQGCELIDPAIGTDDIGHGAEVYPALLAELRGYTRLIEKWEPSRVDSFLGGPRMPIIEPAPWRTQYFADVCCGDDVFIPTDDPEAWA